MGEHVVYALQKKKTSIRRKTVGEKDLEGGSQRKAARQRARKVK